MQRNDDERTAGMANPAAEHTDGLGRETADCIISTGRPVTECRRGLGSNPKTVDKWVAKRRREISGEPGPKAGERELREAQRRIRGLETGNAFPKKAAAFFAREQG